MQYNFRYDIYNIIYNIKKRLKPKRTLIKTNHKQISKMNQDLLLKAQKDEAFKQQMHKNEQRYNTLKQLSQKHQSIIHDGILRKVDDNNKNIYFYFGYMQPTLKKDMSEVVMYMVKHFHPNPNKPYKFVFFNEKCSDNYVLWNFRQIFGYLKLEQITALQQFIVVKPYFYHKTMDWMTFGTIPKFIRSRTKFVYSFQQLCQYLKYSINILAENVPGELYEKQLSYMEMQAGNLSLESQRINFKGQERSDQENNVMLQFQNSIKSMIMKPGYEINNLQDYQIGAQGVPIILKMLIFYFDTHKEGLQQQGIFRKSVSIDEQNQTILQILSKNYDYLLDVKNPHIIANLIKRFCSSLKNPIFPFDKFTKLMNDQGISNKTQHLRQTFDQFPALNKRVLLFIFTFFKQKVLPLQHKNKMNSQNISICLAPCLMRSQHPSAADLIYASKSVMYCRLLLVEFQKIFGTKQQQIVLYRSSYIQNKKNFEDNLDIGLQVTIKVAGDNLKNIDGLYTRNSHKFQNTQIPDPVLIQQQPTKQQVKCATINNQSKYSRQQNQGENQKQQETQQNKTANNQDINNIGHLGLETFESINENNQNVDNLAQRNNQQIVQIEDKQEQAQKEQGNLY